MSISHGWLAGVNRALLQASCQDQANVADLSPAKGR